MDSIVVRGGNPLKGEIKISGAKNATLPIMACSLLTEGELNLGNVPNIQDIKTMQFLLEDLGVDFKIENERYVIKADHVKKLTADYEIVRRMRASIWVLGPMLARFGQAKVSLPGGCAIGSRQVDMHIDGLKSLGAEIIIENGYINAKVKGGLRGNHYNFQKVSVGATIQMIMSATLAKGETKLMNCAIEPEIVDMCKCLVKMGAHIDGIGTNTVKIHGVEKLHGCKYEVISDRIEAGTFMIAAAITKGELSLQNISYEMVENVAIELEQAGSKVWCEDNVVKIIGGKEINAVDIDTQPFPGFSTDLQAQFMALMTLANGTSTITENIFENRFMHVNELVRMGADINIHGRNAVVHGKKELIGAEVMASDLRASVSLILAGLVAKGETKIRRIYHLDRGYENIEEKLRKCGADILRIAGDDV